MFSKLELVCKGYTNKQIAERLIVNSDTVKAHLASIMRKFNVNNRTLVTRNAIIHKLIDLNADLTIFQLSTQILPLIRLYIYINL